MKEYAHPNVLIDTQWLVNHLDDPNIQVVEVDMTPENYNQGHIPGAVFWNIFQDLLLSDLRINFALEKLLERSGITHDTTVIAYGNYGATGAWIFWLLNAIGHEKVLVLNGGRRKWLLDDRPMTKEQSVITPTSYRAKVPDTSLRAFYDEVYKILGRTDWGREQVPDWGAEQVPHCVLLDVRSHKEYTGEWFMSEPPSETERAGHIPGAVHINYELTLNDDGTFKSFEQLDALYRDKNITPELEVIPYCAIGGRSGHTWFVLKYLLGYPNVRNYDGSWNEWSHVKDSPIE